MDSFNHIRGRIADRFKERGVDRLVYFHCDHFEPWSRMNGRSIADPANVADVAAFADQCSRIDFARRLTLFYRTYQNSGYGLSQDLIRTRPDDPFGFIPNKPHEEEAFRAAMKHLVATVDHSIQIHIHHEAFTSRDNHTAPEWITYSDSSEAAECDAERLALAIRLAKDAIRKETDIDLREWFFVHGLWALQGSDSTACRIADELSILMREGCRGDFTFPAARSHVDPKIDVPYFCNAIPCIRGYDKDEANREPAFDNRIAAENKFFVWASRIKSGWSSLDYYSETVRHRLEDPEAWAAELIRDSFYVQGTLFLKTHAHSMQPQYREAARLPIPPHAHPDVQRLLSMIFDGAAAADVRIRFATAPEAYDLLVNQGAVWNGDDAPLEPEGPRSAAPAVTTATARSPVADDAGAPHGADLHVVVAPAGGDGREAEAPESGFLRKGASKQVAPALANDAERLNRVACHVMAGRIAELGEIPSGAYSHYVKAVSAGRLVRPVDIAVVDLLDVLPPFDEYHEVRAGLGVLAMLIALTGRTAIAIDPDPLRQAASAAVFDMAAAAEFPDARPRFSLLRGKFPQIAETHQVKKSLAVLTDFIAIVDETAVLTGLAQYAAALIDIDRFGVQLTTDDQRNRALSRFQAAGFKTICPLLDLGNQGRYYLISANPLPVHREIETP